jgi:hypothetical protein
MFSTIACEALRQQRCLDIRYDGFSRVVEVHAVGVSSAGHDIMRVWQVRGGSVSNERIGWKLLRLDEVLSVNILSEKSFAPRQDYRRGDRAMQRIICEV